jgi:hypothetical protein
MTEHHDVRRWISDLLSLAISGAVAVVLLDLLASWIASKYWGPPNSWNAAVAGAVGGMASRIPVMWHRRPENSK